MENVDLIVDKEGDGKYYGVMLTAIYARPFMGQASWWSSPICGNF